MIDKKAGLAGTELSPVEVFHAIVVNLRAKHIGHNESVVTIERQGKVDVGIRKERKESLIERLLGFADVHERYEAIKRGEIEGKVDIGRCKVLRQHQLYGKRAYHGLASGRVGLQLVVLRIEARDIEVEYLK